MPQRPLMVFSTIVLMLCLATSVQTLCLAQDVCPNRFLCDSVICVYYGSTPEKTTAYRYSVESHYTDTAGTRYLFRDIEGIAYLEWKMMINGDVMFGDDAGLQFKLCADPGESWVFHQFQYETILMTYEGNIVFPVFGEPRICRSYLQTSIGDIGGDGVVDTVPTYRFILHDSLGIISDADVHHGSTNVLQGVLCAHGFTGNPIVSVHESKHDEPNVTIAGHVMIVPVDTWGSGQIRIYGYDGSLLKFQRVSLTTIDLSDLARSEGIRILFWVFESEHGRQYRGSVILH